MGKLRGKVTKDKSSQSVGMEKPQANPSKKNFSIYPDKICQVIKLINKYFCRARGKRLQDTEQQRLSPSDSGGGGETWSFHAT